MPKKDDKISITDKTVANHIAELKKELKTQEDIVEALAGDVLLLQQQKAELENDNKACANVLAVIHRDGGHYVRDHGFVRASKDAAKIVVTLRKENSLFQDSISNCPYCDLEAEESKPQIFQNGVPVKEEPHGIL